MKVKVQKVECDFFKNTKVVKVEKVQNERIKVKVQKVECSIFKSTQSRENEKRGRILFFRSFLRGIEPFDGLMLQAG